MSAARTPDEGDAAQRIIQQQSQIPQSAPPAEPPIMPTPSAPEFGHLPMGNSYRSVAYPPTSPTSEGISSVANAVFALAPAADQVEGLPDAEPGAEAEFSFENISMDEIVNATKPEGEMQAPPSPAVASAQDTREAVQARQLPPVPSAPPLNGDNDLAANLSGPAAQIQEQRAASPDGRRVRFVDDGQLELQIGEVSSKANRAAQSSILASPIQMPVGPARGNSPIGGRSQVLDNPNDLSRFTQTLQVRLPRIVWFDRSDPSHTLVNHRNVNLHNPNMVGYDSQENQFFGHIDAINHVRISGSPHIRNPHQVQFIGIHAAVFAAYAERVSQHIQALIKNEAKKQAKTEERGTRVQPTKVKPQLSFHELSAPDKGFAQSLTTLSIDQLEKRLLRSLDRLAMLEHSIQESREQEKERAADERKSQDLDKDLKRGQLKQELLHQEIIADEILKRSIETSEGIPPKLETVMNMILKRREKAA